MAAKRVEKKTKDWRAGGVVRTTVELPKQLVDDITEAANARGLKTSHIIRVWLMERATAERQVAEVYTKADQLASQGELAYEMAMSGAGQSIRRDVLTGLGVALRPGWNQDRGLARSTSTTRGVRNGV